MKQSSIPVRSQMPARGFIKKYSYDDVIEAMGSIGVPPFPKPDDDKSFKSKYDFFSMLKTIETIAFKRRQLDEEIESQHDKRIEPIMARTKANTALLNDLNIQSRNLKKEIEFQKQKLREQKNKMAEQILAHQNEIREIDAKINGTENVTIPSSKSQSNLAMTAQKVDLNINSKKRKSDGVKNTTKKLIDSYKSENEKPPENLIETSQPKKLKKSSLKMKRNESLSSTTKKDPKLQIQYQKKLSISIPNVEETIEEENTKSSHQDNRKILRTRIPTRPRSTTAQV